jgi:hypothetical protein
VNKVSRIIGFPGPRRPSAANLGSRSSLRLRQLLRPSVFLDRGAPVRQICSEQTEANYPGEQPARRQRSLGYLPNFNTEHPAGSYSARNSLRQHVCFHHTPALHLTLVLLPVISFFYYGRGTVLGLSWHRGGLSWHRGMRRGGTMRIGAAPQCGIAGSCAPLGKADAPRSCHSLRDLVNPRITLPTHFSKEP